MILKARLRSLRRLATALRRDTRALALTEFALATPIVMAIGGYGIEFANLSLTSMKVNQIALNLADNASRVGLTSTLTTTQLRETDLNDVLIGARRQGASIGLTTNGRVTISSLENIQQSYPAPFTASSDTAPVQRIHWQRCIGKMNTADYTSHYGTTSPTTAGQTATPADAGTTQTSGMGESGSQVTAPVGTGVIFVEINYKYQTLFGSMFVSNKIIRFAASFVVRDKRDFSKIYNPAPVIATSNKTTCDLFTT